MDTQKNIDEHMLLDYFSGSLSATQKQEVEEWLNQSEENRKIARDIQYIYLDYKFFGFILLDGEVGFPVNFYITRISCKFLWIFQVRLGV